MDAAGASINGLDIVATLQIQGANTTVLNSTVVYGDSDGECVDIDGATGVVVNDVDVHGCDNAGVQVRSDAAARFVNNSITGTGEGLIAVAGSTADLGTKSHDGRNTLSCNRFGDLSTTAVVLAYGDYWDHVPPTTSNVLANGIDIYTGSGGVVNSTFAMLAANPCT